MAAASNRTSLRQSNARLPHPDIPLSFDAHEAEATRRAVEGWDEPVFYRGQVWGHVRRYSDTLLLARLEALDPETYHESLRIPGEVDHRFRSKLTTGSERCCPGFPTRW